MIIEASCLGVFRAELLLNIRFDLAFVFLILRILIILGKKKLLRAIMNLLEYC